MFHFSTFLRGLLILACILGGCEYLSSLDKLNTQLAELKEIASPAQERADRRRQEWNELKQAKDTLDQLVQREKELLDQKDRLDQKERRLTGEIKYLTDSMTGVVAKLRSSAIGTVIPELKLLGRPALRNAKIFKITDDAISFLHEDGVANLRATTEELPLDLVKKYDLGEKSLSQRLQKLLK